MTDLSAELKARAHYRPQHKVRFVTAASLFDGHDAAMPIMQRILQRRGAEVIHLGLNRSVDDVVTAALQEDVQGIAISSFQGGQVEYFMSMVDLLRQRGGEHIQVFGGGAIVPSDIRVLHDYGVGRIYSSDDAQRMGLQGMIGDMVLRTDRDLTGFAPKQIDAIVGHEPGHWRALAQLLTALENHQADAAVVQALRARAAACRVPVLGITGTGGVGKSSLTDELIRRLRLDQEDQLRVAIISIDPSRRKSGGALLGDRIHMNAIRPWQGGQRVFMRSLATRDFGSDISAALPDMLAAYKVAGFDLIVVETSGMGQDDAAIVSHVDVPVYVMTPEFVAASQLETIDMLNFSAFVAINKFDRKGAADALRDVSKQMQRNQEAWHTPTEHMPVFGTMAARFNDDGVTALYQALKPRLAALGMTTVTSRLRMVHVRYSSNPTPIVPPARARYLADIAETVRGYKRRAQQQSQLAREIQQLQATAHMLKLGKSGRPKAAEAVIDLAQLRELDQDPDARKLLQQWPEMQQTYAADERVVNVRGSEQRSPLTYTTLSGNKVRKVALPAYQDHGEIVKWLMLENVPGAFPFTAGVFAFKREGEDPTGMFAGEGDAFRTNRRFDLLSNGLPAQRLSTAFDSVTLYGADPDGQPDTDGNVGNSGVSIATLDDMKVLYSGFDLCSPTTSVSMTMNGPAPTILAMFLNTAIDQRIDAFQADNGRAPTPAEADHIKAWVLAHVRGTVQADILTEDRGQNTCIFSTEFSLKVMGDIAQYLVQHDVRNLYNASISGYHLAKAGANPISQLAFTLSNGFTCVEAYLARGLHIDDFAPNLSFFFSHGMDPEYTVLGRVARRIWAVTMKEKYGANERSQKLKYHIQTSGRSQHAKETQFNDIRTTLQALIAVYDNCNSLHTNAFNEAMTTPTEDSVRRAMAIQLVINREWGLANNENPHQGAFIIDELTELVEARVLAEFDNIAERGGVLGAMETGYQIGKIQDESMHYEMLKHTGEYPIVGVNTFRNPRGDEVMDTLERARSTEDEKGGQLQRLYDFHTRHAADAPALLTRLQQAAIENDNVFEVLMQAVRVCSLGQITQALFEVGGQYRRDM